MMVMGADSGREEAGSYYVLWPEFEDNGRKDFERGWMGGEQ
jgi:hypothetical protein